VWGYACFKSDAIADDPSAALQCMCKSWWKNARYMMDKACRQIYAVGAFSDRERQCIEGTNILVINADGLL
jgi:hypothetical protein